MSFVLLCALWGSFFRRVANGLCPDVPEYIRGCDELVAGPVLRIRNRGDYIPQDLNPIFQTTEDKFFGRGLSSISLPGCSSAF